MAFLNNNTRTRILTFGLILIAAIPTYFINSFSHPAIIILVPGLLFGLALAIPHIKKYRKHIITLIAFPFVMALLCTWFMGLGLLLGLINNSYSDSKGVILVGIICSLSFLFIIDQYFPITNRITSYTIIALLGIISALIGDYLFLKPHSKELNFGKMIVIWEVIIGLGLVLCVRFDWMPEESKNENMQQ